MRGIYTRLSEADHARVEQAASAEGRSVSNWVAQAVRAQLDWRDKVRELPAGGEPCDR